MTVLAKGGFSPPVDRPAQPRKTRSEYPRDVYFSVDIETDGPIPGPYSLLSFAIVEAGALEDGSFVRPQARDSLYLEMKPISDQFEAEAMAVHGLSRDRLVAEGLEPAEAMRRASEWIAAHTAGGKPVLVAYPLSFDWSWLYWYFVRFAEASPFKHSRCFDIKTALAVKARRPIAGSGHRHLPKELRSQLAHTHHALDDALEQAEVFANLMEWDGP